MATSRDELAALRAAAKRVQRNTGRKINRLADKGVRIAGTKTDPRVSSDRIDRYTATQLKTHLERLGNFNSRRNQYVPGARGVAIPAAEWNKYRQTEKKYNQRIADVRASIENIKLGKSSLTIGQRYDAMVPRTGPSMGGGSMRYFPLNRSSRGVTSPDSIKKLIADLENKMRPNYQSEQEQRIRDNFDKLLKYSNRPDLSDLANQLTPAEFTLLWNFSPAISTLAENYHAILAMLDDDAAALELSGIEESYDEIRDMLQWAVSSNLDQRLKDLADTTGGRKFSRQRKARQRKAK